MSSLTEIEQERLFLTTLTLEEFFDEDEFSKMQYQGFSPFDLLVTLRKRASEKNISEEIHKKNLGWLSALGTMRGTNLTKIQSKTGNEGKNKLKELISIYKVMSKPVGMDDASLSRIAACFARQISDMSHLKGKLFLPVSTDSLTDGFPAGLRVSSAGSLIPSKACWHDPNDFVSFVDAFALHQYHFDKVINPNNKKQSAGSKIKGFVVIQISSKLYSDDIRISHWKGQGLVKHPANSTQIKCKINQNTPSFIHYFLNKNDANSFARYIDIMYPTSETNLCKVKPIDPKHDFNSVDLDVMLTEIKKTAGDDILLDNVVFYIVVVTFPFSIKFSTYHEKFKKSISKAVFSYKHCIAHLVDLNFNDDSKVEMTIETMFKIFISQEDWGISWLSEISKEAERAALYNNNNVELAEFFMKTFTFTPTKWYSHKNFSNVILFQDKGHAKRSLIICPLKQLCFLLMRHTSTSQNPNDIWPELYDIEDLQEDVHAYNNLLTRIGHFLTVIEWSGSATESALACADIHETLYLG
ncbi:unnamed protein product [Brassicogethes aeneus]|uniref:Uncharacterized protein n=1 Tax=Brassicogethes aeneus TaxID=1431903 RepID=A0A9P0FPR4_BRAAE|nr:unnamed protein product [Brassicogethes aeneus]